MDIVVDQQLSTNSHSVNGWCVVIFVSALAGCVLPWVLSYKEAFLDIIVRVLVTPGAVFNHLVDIISGRNTPQRDRRRASQQSDGSSSAETTEHGSLHRRSIRDLRFFPRSHESRSWEKDLMRGGWLLPYMLSFSAGVCLAVAFTMQTNGFQSLVREYGPMKGIKIGSAVVLLSVLAFFVIEQCGQLLQTAIELSETEQSSEIGEDSHRHSPVTLKRESGMNPTTSSADNERKYDDAVSVFPPSTVAELSAPLVTASDHDMISSACDHQHHPAAHYSPCTITQPAMIVTHKTTYLVLGVVFVMFGIHSVAEGMGLGVAVSQSFFSGPQLNSNNNNNAVSIGTGILLHKSLSAFALGSAMLTAAVSPLVYFGLAFAFSSLTPIGVYIGEYFGSGGTDSGSFVGGVFSLLSCGTFIHISLIEFVPQAFDDCSKHFGHPPDDTIHSCLDCDGMAAYQKCCESKAVLKSRGIRLLLFLSASILVLIMSLMKIH